MYQDRLLAGPSVTGSGRPCCGSVEDKSLDCLNVPQGYRVVGSN